MPATQTAPATETVPTYYAVGRNDKWTNEPVPASYFESRGAQVLPARLHGDMTLWINGHNAGALFVSKIDQMAHLRSRGLI